MPHAGIALRRSQSLFRGASKIRRPAIFLTSGLIIHLGLMAVVGFLNGLSWDARVGGQEAFVGLFILVIGYVASFHLLKTKAPWLVAAAVCALLADAIAFRAIITAGLVAQRFAITSVEWLVSASIAGILCMVVPSQKAPDPSKKRPYY